MDAVEFTIYLSTPLLSFDKFFKKLFDTCNEDSSFLDQNLDEQSIKKLFAKKLPSF